MDVSDRSRILHSLLSGGITDYELLAQATGISYEHLENWDLEALFLRLDDRIAEINDRKGEYFTQFLTEGVTV